MLSEKYDANVSKNPDSMAKINFLQPTQLLRQNYSVNFYNAEISKLISGIDIYKQKIQARQKERDKNSKKSLLQVPHKCRNIKCPLDEQPVCAKFTYKNGKHKPFYVTIINQCEMQYMKCRRGKYRF